MYFWFFYPLSNITLYVDSVKFVSQDSTLSLYVKFTYEFMGRVMIQYLNVLELYTQIDVLQVVDVLSFDGFTHLFVYLKTFPPYLDVRWTYPHNYLATKIIQLYSCMCVLHVLFDISGLCAFLSPGSRSSLL